MSADWRSVHALLSEHFEASLGQATTGFQVEPQIPVVVIYHVAKGEPDSENELRDAMLRQCRRVLTEARYDTSWGLSVRTGEHALMVLDKIS